MLFTHNSKYLIKHVQYYLHVKAQYYSKLSYNLAHYLHVKKQYYSNLNHNPTHMLDIIYM